MPRLAPLLALLLLAAGCARQPVETRAPETRILLVRHAERISYDDFDSPLSEAGHARARALRAALADEHIDAIIISQYRRTAETAAPLAAATGIEPEVRALEGDTTVEARTLIRQLAAEFAGRTVLVVSHSNTVPAMLGVLTGHEPPELEGYGELFTVIVPADGPVNVVASRFGD